MPHNVTLKDPERTRDIASKLDEFILEVDKVFLFLLPCRRIGCI